MKHLITGCTGCIFQAASTTGTNRDIHPRNGQFNTQLLADIPTELLGLLMIGLELMIDVQGSNRGVAGRGSLQ